MKSTLQPGLTYEFKFTIPENKTVPYLYPESPEFQVMPKVLATGFLVGLFECGNLKLRVTGRSLAPFVAMVSRTSLTLPG